MLKELICPQCGGKMEVDEEKEKAYCIYCGSELVNFHQKIDINQNINVSGEVTAKLDRSNEPNLIIDFSCEDPSGRMIITFNNSKMKRVINNGQTVEMRMPLGHTVAIMDLAGRSYKRDIWIVEKAPVRINASAFGRREIVIEQPDYQVPGNAQTNNQNTQVQQVRGPEDPSKPLGMSVAAFILSVIVIGFPVGLPLGIVSLILSIKQKKKKGFSIAAIIISAVILLAVIIGIANGSSGSTTN